MFTKDQYHFDTPKQCRDHFQEILYGSTYRSPSTMYGDMISILEASGKENFQVNIFEIRHNTRTWKRNIAVVWLNYSLISMHHNCTQFSIHRNFYSNYGRSDVHTFLNIERFDSIFRLKKAYGYGDDQQTGQKFQVIELMGVIVIDMTDWGQENEEI